jgi:hypothetical protein
MIIIPNAVTLTQRPHTGMQARRTVFFFFLFLFVSDSPVPGPVRRGPLARAAAGTQFASGIAAASTFGN